MSKQMVHAVSTGFERVKHHKLLFGIQVFPLLTWRVDIAGVEPKQMRPCCIISKHEALMWMCLPTVSYPHLHKGLQFPTHHQLYCSHSSARATQCCVGIRPTFVQHSALPTVVRVMISTATMLVTKLRHSLGGECSHCELLAFESV